MKHAVFPEWLVSDRERNIHPPHNSNLIFLLNFHIEALTSNVISLNLWSLTSVEGQSAGFSRHKELPSLTRLQQSHMGQRAGHQRQGCNWQMGVWLGSGLAEDIQGVFLLDYTHHPFSQRSIRNDLPADVSTAELPPVFHHSLTKPFHRNTSHHQLFLLFTCSRT